MGNALQAGTIDIDIDDMQGSGIANGGSLTVHNLTGVVNSTVHITGGDSLTLYSYH